MPINSAEFEKGSRESNVLLTEFLRSNYSSAYSLDELVEVMASIGKNLTREEVERILTSLEYGRKIESKMIAGVTYYKYYKFMSFSPPTRPR